MHHAFCYSSIFLLSNLQICSPRCTLFSASMHWFVNVVDDDKFVSSICLICLLYSSWSSSAKLTRGSSQRTVAWMLCLRMLLRLMLTKQVWKEQRASLKLRWATQVVVVQTVQSWLMRNSFLFLLQFLHLLIFSSSGCPSQCFIEIWKGNQRRAGAKEEGGSREERTAGSFPQQNLQFPMKCFHFTFHVLYRHWVFPSFSLVEFLSTLIS